MNIQRHPEFPQHAAVVYLNHAAVGPWPQRSARAVQDFATENMRYGAAHYPDWVARETRLRERLRSLINAPSADDIALLKNTSEGLSIIAYGLDWRPGDNIVLPEEEFPSNRIVWQSLAQFGVQTRLVSFTAGADPEAALMAQVDGQTRLLATSAIQYASGLRMDLARLGAFCKERQVLFCVDAIQQLGALRFDAQAIGADFVVADGHKWMLGPEGLALFYCTPQQREALRLQQYGWHMVQEPTNYTRLDWQPASSARRFECGSPNMLGIFALEASLGLLSEIGMATIEEKVLQNASYLIDRVADHKSLELLSPGRTGRHGGIVTFRHRQLDPQKLYAHLMANGIVCAQRGGGIRFSPHFYTQTGELDRALDEIENCHT